MNCKICKSPSEKIFEKIILQKHPTNYYKCTQCSFVQTDEVTWLKEAYESAITSLDIGLIYRNNHLAKEVKPIINICFPEAKTMLDYAGGYGAFVRLMRDEGFNFYRQDDYCDNIFANYFDVTDTDIKKFDLVTGFEVLEHFNDPMNDIATIFEYSDNAIFSTEITPKTNKEIENWWYITEETGQHIAFYSEEAMQLIAKHFNKNYYCKNGNLHIFTSKNLSGDQIKFGIEKPKFLKSFFKYIIKKKYTIKRKSLLEADYNYIKNKLNS
ncbi:MAG: class I SAM-dependent methyltransferase [Flavobacteriales bacterium]|nr:class I SAM-dependent methyltransferase [Flavobacteriales bacterium]